MLGRVHAVALNTFREAVRNKIVLVVLGVVVLFNLFALVLGAMSLNEQARVARDVGLSGISLFGAFTAIFLGVSLLYGEVQRRTIQFILAKPIHRHEFVLGKYVGMSMTLTILVAAFSLALMGLLRLAEVDFDANAARAVTLGWIEVMIVAAIAVFFSSFATPFMSAVFSTALFAIGRWWDELRWAAERSKVEVIRVTARAALYVVPDLHLYSVSGSEVDGQPVSVHAAFVGWDYVGSAALYGAVVIAILLGLSMLIFTRRDFV